MSTRVLAVAVMTAGLALAAWAVWYVNDGTPAAVQVVSEPAIDVTDRTTVTEPNASPVPHLETGPETACATDEQCRCRLYTGTEFIPGSSVSQCCRTTDDFRCPGADHCARCIYL